MSLNQQIHFSNSRNIQIWIKREDLLHPEVSGNKYRKLKDNLAFAKAKNHSSILTFGGAYSNHIAATAAAGTMEGLQTIAIIRGEELGMNLAETLTQNPTLAFAASYGMELHFVSRAEYREKDEAHFRESIKEKFDNPYIVPEGGTNSLAIKGCEEILTEDDEKFDFVCCAVGTGGTVAGLINSATASQNVLAFPALKGAWIQEEIEKWTEKKDWKIISDYHFGGYARINKELVSFINNFKQEYDILLDPVYTGKMMFGIFEMVDKGYFPENSRILAVHTGGLQGVAGMNIKLQKKGLPLIQVS